MLPTIKTFEEEVPVTTNKITVVTEYDNSGLLIQDYVNGKPLEEYGGIYVSCADFDDAILTYHYIDNTAYVDWSVKGKFKLLWDNAELFVKCGRSIDAYAKALDERELEYDIDEDEY